MSTNFHAKSINLRLSLCFIAPAFALMVTACASSNLSAARSATDDLSGEQITAIIAAPDRSAADQKNDLRRKPELLLPFMGIRAGMTVLDVSAGGGYTTELLARAVGPDGRVYGQSAPAKAANPAASPVAPEGDATPQIATTAATTAVPRSSSAEALAKRALKPLTHNIVAVVQPFEDPVSAELVSAKLDLVTLMFNYHDLGHMGVDRARMNAAIFKALKPGGTYVIADHSGRAGTGISEAGTLHRIEEDFLRKEVEQAGFKLAAEGNFLRNPSDPRDKNTPEPAQPKDEFVLKFVKP